MGAYPELQRTRSLTEMRVAATQQRIQDLHAARTFFQRYYVEDPAEKTVTSAAWTAIMPSLEILVPEGRRIGVLWEGETKGGTFDGQACGAPGTWNVVPKLRITGAGLDVDFGYAVSQNLLNPVGLSSFAVYQTQDIPAVTSHPRGGLHQTVPTAGVHTLQVYGYRYVCGTTAVSALYRNQSLLVLVL